MFAFVECLGLGGCMENLFLVLLLFILTHYLLFIFSMNLEFKDSSRGGMLY